MLLLLPFFLLSLLLFKEDPPRIIHDDDNITSWLFLLVTVEAQAQRHSHTQHKTTIMHRMSNWFFLSSCCPVHASLKIASHLYIIVWRLCTTYTKHNFMHELLCFDAVPFHLCSRRRRRLSTVNEGSIFTCFIISQWWLLFVHAEMHHSTCF